MAITIQRAEGIFLLLFVFNVEQARTLIRLFLPFTIVKNEETLLTVFTDSCCFFI